MGPLQQLESKLDELLDKKAPVKIPQEGRRTLAHAYWWIALIIGVLQLWWAVHFWQWGHRADELVDRLSYYTGGLYVHHLSAVYYLSVVTMAVVGVLLLIATPSLKAMKKAGWDLLFITVLVQVVAAVLRLFTEGGGFGSFLGGLIGATIGAYLLFQTRECFIMSHPADHKVDQHTAKPEAHDDTHGKDEAKKHDEASK